MEKSNFHIGVSQEESTFTVRTCKQRMHPTNETSISERLSCREGTQWPLYKPVAFNGDEGKYQNGDFAAHHGE